MSRPSSWAECQERLARALASAEDAAEWTRQALSAAYGADDPADLSRQRRALAFQKLSGVVLALEDADFDVAFALDVRDRLRELVGRYFGAAVDGPEWRLTPFEDDRPTEKEVNDPFRLREEKTLREIIQAAAEREAVRAEKGIALPPGGLGPDGV